MNTREKMIIAITLVTISIILLGSIYESVLFLRQQRNLRERFDDRPQQYVYAEVIGKRRQRDSVVNSRDLIYYIISFKLSDGLVKELQVGDDLCREVFDSIYVGDTGMLLYKEIENIEENIRREERYWTGRRFIGFKKDS
jgi:hypothetical protein